MVSGQEALKNCHGLFVEQNPEIGNEGFYVKFEGVNGDLGMRLSRHPYNYLHYLFVEKIESTGLAKEWNERIAKRKGRNPNVNNQIVVGDQLVAIFDKGKLVKNFPDDAFLSNHLSQHPAGEITLLLAHHSPPTGWDECRYFYCPKPCADGFCTVKPRTYRLYDPQANRVVFIARETSSKCARTTCCCPHNSAVIQIFDADESGLEKSNLVFEVEKPSRCYGYFACCGVCQPEMTIYKGTVDQGQKAGSVKTSLCGGCFSPTADLLSATGFKYTQIKGSMCRGSLTPGWCEEKCCKEPVFTIMNNNQATIGRKKIEHSSFMGTSFFPEKQEMTLRWQKLTAKQKKDHVDTKSVPCCQSCCSCCTCCPWPPPVDSKIMHIDFGQQEELEQKATVLATFFMLDQQFNAQAQEDAQWFEGCKCCDTYCCGCRIGYGCCLCWDSDGCVVHAVVWLAICVCALCKA